MSGFTSLLKKIGQVLSVGLTITSEIFPFLQPLLGSAVNSGSAANSPNWGGRIVTGVNDFTAIASTVVQIETAMQGKTGIDKLAAAATLVQNIVRTSEVVSGHQIAQEPEFIAGCTDLTNAIVRIMNSLSSNAIKTGGNPAPAPAPPATPAPAVPSPAPAV